MGDDLSFAEDLPRTAQDAFYLAGRLCVSCQNIHAVRPYIRLSRGSTGMESEMSGLGPVMADLLGTGRHRILIAGALDTGILACVARAAVGHRADIVVLDICATPLELCRKYAERCGRLVLLFKTRMRTADGLAAQNVDGATQAVISDLHRLGVALPEPDEAFAVRLKAFARGSAAHTDAFSSPEEVDALLDSAGFAIETRRQIDLDRGGPKKGVTARDPTHRYFVIASCGTD